MNKVSFNLNPSYNNFIRTDKPKLSLISFQGKVSTHLKPDEILNIFEKEISPIYRESGHCEEISNYLAQELKKEGFEVTQQQQGAGKGNIIAHRNVQNDNAIILQAHTDMVYVARGKNINKEKGIKVLNDGHNLTAKGTSLGADDGIGVAVALGIARIKDPDFRNIPLQLIFTVDEEVGLLGAKDLPADVLKGKYLIGLDNGNPNGIIVGCSGIADFECHEMIPTTELSTLTDKQHAVLKIDLTGAKGGHSGLDINKGRLNALKTIIEELSQFEKEIKITKISGGEKNNSIPTSASAEILIPAAQAQQIIDQIEHSLEQVIAEHKKAEPLLKLKLSQNGFASPQTEVMTPEFQSKFFKVFAQSLKNGAITVSEGAKKPVTSQNLGSMTLENGYLNLALRMRSNCKEEHSQELQQTQKLLSVLLDKIVTPANVTPVWEPPVNPSPLTNLAVETYKEAGIRPVLSNPHGTVEGGIFSTMRKDLDQIGVGPEIKNMHTPDERLSIPSVDTFCRIIESLIQKVYKKSQEQTVSFNGSKDLNQKRYYVA